MLSMNQQKGNKPLGVHLSNNLEVQVPDLQAIDVLVFSIHSGPS